MERVQKEFTDKVIKQMEKENLDAILISAPDAIFYITGYASSFLYKSYNFGLTVLAVKSTGEMALVMSEFEQQAAGRRTEGITFITYPTWIYIEDYAVEGQTKDVQPDPNKSFKYALEWLGGVDKNNRIGIQYDSIKFTTWDYFNSIYKKEQLIDLKDLLIEIRTYKTDWEIDTIREATRIAETAMYLTAKATVPGMTDVEVNRIFTNRVYEQSQDVVEVKQDHTFGANFAPGRILEKHVLKRGDIIRLDGGPIFRGYNSDIARSYAVGGITNKENEEIYEALWKGRRAAQSILAPGVKRSTVFNTIQDAIHKGGLPGYIRGHHGHSLGCASFGEEYPFIAPDDDRVFEPGQIFCLEVPYYSSKHHSYNIEDTFLVTENGIEFFSNAIDSLYF